MQSRRRIGTTVVMVLGITAEVNAQGGAAIIGQPTPDLPYYEPGQEITVEISAILTAEPPNGQLVRLRGLQMDYQLSADLDLPQAMEFNNINPYFYWAFPDLPVPAMVWAVHCDFPPCQMLELTLDEPTTLGWITFNATDTEGLLDFANGDESGPYQGFNLNFGFGVDPNDPITDWRFDTGELTGDQNVAIAVPEPGTLGMLSIGAVALLRRRRDATPAPG